MEFEFWWLLLALMVFFGLGWLAARVDIKHLVSESRTLPRSYFRGLNFLLNEQPDQAIEAFIEVVKVDSETIELHFALGGLFRRRGETERAIRMHQNLLTRADLKPEQSLHAVMELGQDYLKAGLLDRAEEMFQRLLGSPHRTEAMRFLLEIYEQEKEWRKAIEIAQQLPAESAQTWQREIAQCYCELATGEITHGRLGSALEILDRALSANRKCVRASMLEGDVHFSAGRFVDALESWKRIEQQNPAYLALVAQKLLAAHREIGADQTGLSIMRAYLDRYPSLDLLDVSFQATLDREGADAAYQLVRHEIRRNPTLLGLDKLLEAQLILSMPEQRHDLELVKNLVHTHTRRLARYRCESCGFKARQFYWRCPACGGWETYPPRRTEEFDLAP